MPSMRIAVKAHPHQKQEWLAGHTENNFELLWMDNDIPAADAYFDLTFEEYGAAFPGISDKPVFINAVINALDELPSNASRINAWKGFLKKDIAELVLRNDDAKNILDAMGWKYRQVPDITGMIAPRTICMIINEAYFALGDEVSSKEDIDIAMKLGTNYPYGPFEWCGLIGAARVAALLQALATGEPRYQPCSLLQKEAIA